jgi:Uma2 family endonuclease
VNISVNLDLSSLPATLASERPLSDAEFQEFCIGNSKVQIERTSDGLVHIYPLNGAMTSSANASITGQLRSWWHTHRQGLAVGSSAGFFLPDRSMLCPNAAYVSQERLERISVSEREGIPHVCPDFVIELLTNWESVEALQRKLDVWINNGVTVAWLINPVHRTVTIYEAGTDSVSFGIDTVTGKGPVAGFDLDLGEVWSCYDL